MRKDIKKQVNIFSVIVLGFILILLLYFLLYSPYAKVNRYVRNGDNYSIQQEFQLAIEAYEQALEIDPQSVEALERIVSLHLGQAHYSAAKGYLDQLSTVSEDSPKYRSLLYAYAMDTRDYALADSLLEAEDNAYAPNEEEYRALIVGLNEDAYFTQASRVLDQALAKFPNSEVLSRLGLKVYYDAGDYIKTSEAYESYEYTLSSDQLNTIAELYLDLENEAKAFEVWEKSLDLDIKQRDLQKKVLEYYIQSRNLSKYSEWLKKIEGAGLDVPDVNLNIQGNRSWQTRYSGLFAVEGNHFYFSDLKRKGVYFADKTDDSGLELILTLDATDLNLVGGILYFTKPSEDNSLYSYDRSTESLNLISNQNFSDFIVVGNNVLYLDNEGYLCLFHLQTREDFRITQKRVLYYVFDKNGIYFIGLEDNNLYKKSFDFFSDKYQAEELIEISDELLLEGPFNDLVIDDANNLYLVRQLDKHIISFNLNNKHISTIYEDASAYLNYSNDNLIFVSWTPQRFDLEQGHVLNLASNISSELFVDDKTIYSIEYLNSDQSDYQIYRFSLDGTNWHKFWG